MIYSRSAEYAIRAFVNLAQVQEGKYAMVKNIAEQEDIPAHFLAKILQQLARKGLLRSSKGPTGGFALRVDAGDVRLLDIVEALDGQLPRGCRFLGSHPIAGSEKGGPSYAQANLFEGRVAVLTPTRNTRAEDFDFLEEFWEGLGSVVLQMSPEEHDRALAVTSHLPHLAAVALAATVSEPLFRLAGTGLLDATRLAASDPGLWQQILLMNRGNVLTALEQFGGNLSALHAAIRDRNEAELKRFLTMAKKNRDALGS